MVSVLPRCNRSKRPSVGEQEKPAGERDGHVAPAGGPSRSRSVTRRTPSAWGAAGGEIANWPPIKPGPRDGEHNCKLAVRKRGKPRKLPASKRHCNRRRGTERRGNAAFWGKPDAACT